MCNVSRLQGGAFPFCLSFLSHLFAKVGEEDCPPLGRDGHGMGLPNLPTFSRAFFFAEENTQVVLPQPAAPISVLNPDERIAAQRFGYHACTLFFETRPYF